MRLLSQLLCLTLSFSPIFAGQFPLAPPTPPGYEQGELSVVAKSELLYLHRKLVEIESISGNEKRVGDWLAPYLEEHGLTVEKQHVSKDRFNLLAYPGKESKTKILVTSHIDTVGVLDFSISL
jgi:acetylornithine deacetylase